MDRSFEVYCGQASLPWTQSLTQRRIDWMCAQARGYVLDVGCSQGIVPWLLAQKGLDVTGVDADAVIETKRGHTLGRVIYHGTAIPAWNPAHLL